jgi:hypothetical protein
MELRSAGLKQRFGLSAKLNSGFSRRKPRRYPRDSMLFPNKTAENQDDARIIVTQVRDKKASSSRPRNRYCDVNRL